MSRKSRGLGLYDELQLMGHNLADYAASAVTPVMRLGVTGLSGAGKTVFITSLINALLRGGRLPVFEPMAARRIRKVYIDTQPDDTCPRFAFERHEEALKATPPHWPQSTSRISQIRLTIEFDPLRGWGPFARNRLHLDIVDYPGEWLLDLPLLGQSFSEWSMETWQRARGLAHKELAEDWLNMAVAADNHSPFTEPLAEKLSDHFKTYLKKGRERRYALSTLPPGRFLLPGDMEGSPALTFSPLKPLEEGDTAPHGSLWQEMERRFEAYKQKIVRPFFRDQFARLDAQIVLIDMLSALNAGPEAMDDLEGALSNIIEAFRFGRPEWYSAPFRRAISRVVFAATKADHLHSRQHDAFEKLFAELVGNTAKGVGEKGASYSILALSALRATWETEARTGGVKLPCVAGRPEAGERLGGVVYDGEKEAAVFPGDLPKTLRKADGSWESFKGLRQAGGEVAEAVGDYAFLRFTPPDLEKTPHWPHIRLDKAMEILLAEALQ